MNTIAEQVAPIAAASEVKVETPFRRFCTAFLDSKVATTALIVLGILIFMALSVNLAIHYLTRTEVEGRW